MSKDLVVAETPGLDDIFIIGIGRLTTIDSLHRMVSRRLLEYSDLYRRGLRPKVRISLVELQPGSVGMAALTAFMSIADRIREFVGGPVEIELTWNPALFGFLDDIGFFRLAQQRDLFIVPTDLLGGYEKGKTNPNTRIVYFDNEGIPSADTIGDALIEWKDSVRTNVKESLLISCGSLFRPSKTAFVLPVELRDQVAVTSAELVVNSLLWGQASAYVGLQRSSSRITVCVCDSGVGFFNALQTRKNKSGFTPDTHFDALALGCIINKEDFGLRRAIDMVTRFGGTVTISTYSAQISWRTGLWQNWLDLARNVDGTWQDVGRAIKEFRARCLVVDDVYDKSIGYVKEWELPMRGTRVTFELPIRRTSN